MSDPANRYVSPLTEFTSEHCKELTRFDRAMTGKYYWVEDDLYQRLFDFGARVAGHLDAEGRIISSCALYPERLNAPDFHPLERDLPEWAAFADAAAVDPNYRHILPDSRHLHTEHIQWRKGEADNLGKQALMFTVRDDNLPSARNMLTNGCYGVAHTPNFSAKAPTWRKVMVLPLIMPNLFAREFTASYNPIVLEVRHNQATPRYSQRVAELLREDYIEYACADEIGADPKDPTRICWTHFGRIASFLTLDRTTQDKLAFFKSEILARC